MRTTVELPPDLMRRAKAKAAARGESLKALLARAVSAEVGAGHHSAKAKRRARVPIFGSPDGPRVKISNTDIARALAHDDEIVVRRSNKKQK